MTRLGSLQNVMMADARNAEGPEVGMGATRLGWTDRIAARLPAARENLRAAGHRSARAGAAMTSILDRVQLNEAQRAAVEHQGGPLAILSVAGSGKTHVIACRVARMIERGVDPGSIAAVTFTKKAAGEMLERVGGMAGDGASDCTIRTFHSLCALLLKQAGHAKQIIEGHRQERLLREAMAAAGIDEHPADILRAIGFAANSLIGPAEIERMEGGSFKGVAIGVLVPAMRVYEAAKVRAKVYDFDDLLTHALELVRGGAGDAVRDRYRVVLVDEFQDTNTAQFEFLRAVCPPENSPELTVVGDDDQSIYGWRAARPSYLIDFGLVWKDATMIRMENNYRCQAAVIEPANRLIHHNAVRVPKVLTATLPALAAPEVLLPLDENAEAAMLTDAMRGHLDGGGRWSDVAILYRTNAMSRALEDACIKGRVPYRLLGGTSFYGRKEVRDLVAYARLAASPDDDEAFMRIYNVPNRYLGAVAINAVQREATARRTSLFTASATLRSYPKPYMPGRFDLLRALIREAAERGRQANPGDLLRWLAQQLSYRLYLSAQGGDQQDDSRWENCEALFRAADGFATLGDFAFYARNAASPKQQAGEKKDAVTLLTLHRAKGLEWPVVMIAGATASMLPHRRSEDHEEERRLMYVGMTRAKARLIIGCPAFQLGRAAGPSPYIAEAGLTLPGPAVQPQEVDHA